MKKEIPSEWCEIHEDKDIMSKRNSVCKKLSDYSCDRKLDVGKVGNATINELHSILCLGPSNFGGCRDEYSKFIEASESLADALVKTNTEIIAKQNEAEANEYIRKIKEIEDESSLTASVVKYDKNYPKWSLDRLSEEFDRMMYDESHGELDVTIDEKLGIVRDLTTSIADPQAVYTKGSYLGRMTKVLTDYVEFNTYSGRINVIKELDKHIEFLQNLPKK